jgi:hypothetical protein
VIAALAKRHRRDHTTRPLQPWAASDSGAATVGLVLGAAGVLLVALAAAVLVPNLARAVDPGCAAYKGAGLSAYRAAIADLNGGRPAADLDADGARAVGALRAAAADSGNRATAGALSALAGDLGGVLGDLRAGVTVPARALSALNNAAASADTACGTLRL